jgi:hypothetical protein
LGFNGKESFIFFDSIDYSLEIIGVMVNFLVVISDFLLSGINFNFEFRLLSDCLLRLDQLVDLFILKILGF